MSSIYSFYAGSHSATSCLIIDGEIKSIIEEERLTRIKAGDNYYSYPDLSSEKIENTFNLKVSDADYRVAVKPSPDAYYRALLKAPYEKCSHHDAHNYGCYFTSGFDGRVISISHDGGGESSMSKVFLCEDGEMNQVLDGKLYFFGSLAQLWAMSTIFLNYNGGYEKMWKMCKDEGKLMGMAPEGRYDENIYKILSSMVNYQEMFFGGAPTNWRTRFVMREMARKGYFDSQEQKEIFAFNLQKFTEDTFLKFLDDLHKLYPSYTKLCLSGGLFANVKLNQKINELEWVEEIFIHPAMGDEGLSLGAGLKKAKELNEIKKPFRLKNVFFGLSYSDDEIFEVSKNYDFIREPYDVKSVAQKIHEGKIIGWFKGRFEYGPRALGNRSILTRATDINSHKELNLRLKRHEIMPFAPSILKEFFDDIFFPNKSLYTAEFMTLCYETKKEWIDIIPAVLQKTDKSARPHVVTKDNNLEYHTLISEYHKISNIPLLLNTSFNSHNEPIIDKPQEAFESLKKGIIDELVIENYVYKNR